MDDEIKAKLDVLIARQRRFGDQFQTIKRWLDGLSQEVYCLRQHYEEANNLETQQKETK